VLECACACVYECAGRCVCALVALLIQHATRMRCVTLLFMDSLALSHFSTLSHKGNDFRKKLLNIKYVFLIFRTTFTETVRFNSVLQRLHSCNFGHQNQFYITCLCTWVCVYKNVCHSTMFYMPGFSICLLPLNVTKHYLEKAASFFFCQMIIIIQKADDVSFYYSLIRGSNGYKVGAADSR
jgi:hypothetical protein